MTDEPTLQQQRERELEAIVRISEALRGTESHTETLANVLEQVTGLLQAQSACLAFPDPNTGETVFEFAVGAFEPLVDLRIAPGESLTGEVIATGKPFITDDIRSDPQAFGAYLLNQQFAVVIVPLITQAQTIGALWIARDRAFDASEVRLLTTVADISANALHRVRLYEQTRRYADQLATINQLGRNLAETLNLDEIYTRLSQAIHQLLPEITAVLISFYDADAKDIVCVYAESEEGPMNTGDFPPLPLKPPGLGTQSEVIHTRKPLIVEDLEARLQINGPVVAFGDPDKPAQTALYVPMLAKGKVLGLIQVQSHIHGRFSQTEADLMALVSNTAAIAIENARLFTETERRLHRLTSLRAMDIAISSSFDLRVTLSLLLDQVVDQLEVDAADILIYNVHTQMLDYAAGRGFRGPGLGRIALRLGNDLPGRVVLDRQMLVVPDITAAAISMARKSVLQGEEFVTSYGMPLIVKGQVVGVLEIFHRKALSPDGEWLDFLETLAADTAIAIDNAQLFNQLERANTDLYLAYDAMLEGWAHTLELRGLEAEGHYHDVVDLTLELAQCVGMSTNSIVHIRRGVLLHDVGMISIPDHILFKPGPLTEAERSVVQQHPVVVYQMFAPIAFLRPALDIPYAHHERWDGSGYPRGVRGEQIPLAARVFSVVDVWDAMRSDRPYRSSWPEDEVRRYLSDQAGGQFDPKVVDEFLTLIDQKKQTLA